MNILTAHEFIAQGTRAYQIVSMAGSSPARRELLDIARTVASLTGRQHADTGRRYAGSGSRKARCQ